MAKTTHAEEDGFTPELMVSIITGDDANPVACVAPATGGQTAEIGLASDLVSCIRFTGGVPVADIVDTATVSEVGMLDPGVDINTDAVIVTWLHYPGDGDPYLSKT